MSHQHSHSHPQNSSVKTLWFVFLINLVFSLLELVGGYLFNSTALLSDAIHDFGDAVILLFSVLIAKWSLKSASKAYPYGFQRLSIIGALLNSIILFLGSILMIIHAVERLREPEMVVSLGMFMMSIVGIGANILAAYQLNGRKNILDRSVMAHLLEDLYGWVAVFIGSILIYFTNWYWIDPIISLLISIIILRNVYRNFEMIYQLIMLKNLNLPEQKVIEAQILALDGIIDIVDIKMWSLDGEHSIITMKIKSEQEVANILKKDITTILANYPFWDTTIELIFEG